MKDKKVRYQKACARILDYLATQGKTKLHSRDLHVWMKDCDAELFQRKLELTKISLEETPYLNFWMKW